VGALSRTAFELGRLADRREPASPCWIVPRRWKDLESANVGALSRTAFDLGRLDDRQEPASPCWIVPRRWKDLESANVGALGRTAFDLGRLDGTARARCENARDDDDGRIGRRGQPAG
jgi:hypothetical protein